MSQGGGFVADVPEWWVYGRCHRVVGLWPMSKNGGFMADVQGWWVSSRCPRMAGF